LFLAPLALEYVNKPPEIRAQLDESARITKLEKRKQNQEKREEVIRSRQNRSEELERINTQRQEELEKKRARSLEVINTMADTARLEAEEKQRQSEAQLARASQDNYEGFSGVWDVYEYQYTIPGANTNPYRKKSIKALARKINRTTAYKRLKCEIHIQVINGMVLVSPDGNAWAMLLNWNES